MDNKAVSAKIYSWIAEDFSEYCKLVGLSLKEISDGECYFATFNLPIFNSLFLPHF